jgi:hypothetical protein
MSTLRSNGYMILQTLMMAIALAAASLLELPITPLAIASFALFSIQWLFSSLTRYAVFRIIPCPQKEIGSASMTLSAVLRCCMMICLTIAYVSIEKDEIETETEKVVRVALLYRAMNKAYHCPLTASIESLVLLYDQSLVMLAVASFALNRALIFRRKATYILTSVITAVKNKKQRFSSQGLCFVLEFTVFLPITLGVLLITTILDTATIPYLGFAFFIIGYPKPVRGWSSINLVEANPEDERSDGHLYHAMMPQLSAEIQKIITGDPFNFGRGSFYFMKNEKMIVLIQVLERGTNYVLITVKGTELQETTVCHAEENDNINQITE